VTCSSRSSASRPYAKDDDARRGSTRRSVAGRGAGAQHYRRSDSRSLRSFFGNMSSTLLDAPGGRFRESGTPGENLRSVARKKKKKWRIANCCRHTGVGSGEPYMPGRRLEGGFFYSGRGRPFCWRSWDVSPRVRTGPASDGLELLQARTTRRRCNAPRCVRRIRSRGSRVCEASGGLTAGPALLADFSVLQDGASAVRFRRAGAAASIGRTFSCHSGKGSRRFVDLCRPSGAGARGFAS